MTSTDQDTWAKFYVRFPFDGSLVMYDSCTQLYARARIIVRTSKTHENIRPNLLSNIVTGHATCLKWNKLNQLVQRKNKRDGFKDVMEQTWLINMHLLCARWSIDLSCRFERHELDGDIKANVTSVEESWRFVFLSDNNLQKALSKNKLLGTCLWSDRPGRGKAKLCTASSNIGSMGQAYNATGSNRAVKYGRKGRQSATSYELKCPPQDNPLEWQASKD